MLGLFESGSEISVICAGIVWVWEWD